ncbi:MAG: transporter substrate-binding domain-containing protein [Hyphomicrobiales bacterium]|nr:transporter substrate-binding domain-containing protein [Hyphomicrobiales bacterium]
MQRRDLAKSLVLAGAAVAVANTAARAQGAPAAGGGRLAEILKRGSVRIGTTGDFNPMSFRNPGSNEYTGFDIEAMAEFAKDLGVKIEWVPTEWATLVAGIAANRYDIFSGASVSMGRARTAAFSLPYIEAGTVPLSLKANAGRFKTWESINDAGVKVAVSMGTVFHDQAKAHFPKATIQAVQTPATGFQEVLAGRADVTITSNVEASTLVKRFDQLVVNVQGTEMRNRRPFAYVVAQDDPTWLNYVNTWVTLKKSEGFFDMLQAKWLPSS